MAKEKLEIIKTHIKNTQYVTQSTTKKGIILHHSAGSSVKSMFDWWNITPERIGVSYAIDRDGKIYEAFPSKFWASHLGIKGNNQLDKQTIGIELVSIGGLTKTTSGWKSYVNKVIPNGEVWEVPKNETYRGYQAFQKYNPKQIDSLISLIRDILERHPEIKIQDGGLWEFWEYNPEVITKNLGGIWSHTTVRKDKSDIFPQPDLIERLMKSFS